jgi:hypothetical protein
VAYVKFLTPPNQGEHNMKNWIPSLKKILKKARISPLLRIAVEDTITALQTKDLDQAYQLTACKSHITGRLDPHNKQYAFQEDHDYNQTLNKDKASVYTILDVIHHDIAWKIDAMPSGMVTLCLGPKGPVAQEMKPAGTHPVIRRIKLEHNRNKRRSS